MPNWAEEIVAPVVGETRDKFVHTQLLHDQPRYAHAYSGAKDSQQPGQTGNQKNFQLFYIAGEQTGKVQVDHSYKQRANRQNKQHECQYDGK